MECTIAHPRDQGRAFESLRASVDDSLKALDGLEAGLAGGWDAPAPEAVMEVFERADKAVTELITMTHIEDQYPRLHGPRAEFRVAWRNVR